MWIVLAIGLLFLIDMQGRLDTLKTSVDELELKISRLNNKVATLSYTGKE